LLQRPARRLNTFRPELAGYLQIEERKYEAGGLN
jgi:hypothetical protein